MEFNNKLYELRKQKGFSQEELLVSWSPSRLHAHRGRTHQVKEVESLPACPSLGSEPK